MFTCRGFVIRKFAFRRRASPELVSKPVAMIGCTAKYHSGFNVFANDSQVH